MAHPSLALACVLLVSACASPLGLMDLSERPAEGALLLALRAYDDGQYQDAERHFNTAVQKGLVSPRDLSVAQKHLAFIYCTSNRPLPCEAAFKAARAADPKFALSKAEAGHPLWGPIYQKLIPKP